MAIQVLPQAVNAEAFEAALDAIGGVVGGEHVLINDSTLLEYATFTDPRGETPPAGVVRPGSTEEVQAIMSILNERRLPVYPISRGKNHGLGLAMAVDRGNVILDLRRLDQIFDVDVELGYVDIGVGVTYAQLYGYLAENDIPLWISPTSGPEDGSVIGNALDKGAGYVPMADHYFNLCGMEIVLADGSLLHTGDGPRTKTWHVHRWGCGPVLDGLFVQSNMGVVTRGGMGLLPKPPGARTFTVSFPDDDDVGDTFELARALKFGGPVQSTISIGNDLYQAGHLISDPSEIAGGERPIPKDALLDFRRRFDVGAWSVFGALYGPEPMLDLGWQGVQKLVAAFPKARLLDHEEVLANPALSYRVDHYTGRTNEAELELYKLRPNGVPFYFLPALRLRGEDATEAHRIYSTVLPQYGFDQVGEYLCFPKASRSTFLIIFDSGDEEERERAVRCYRALVEAFEASSFLISRVPTFFQDEIVSRLPDVHRAGAAVKGALDPNGIIAPGRYGLRVNEASP